ncbi:MAG TPA: hypothetical protein VLR71_04230 [Casimicrobiaceae bacterium]|nr:hypothetical protein [Casimicrobiaceae bacterium]
MRHWLFLVLLAASVWGAGHWFLYERAVHHAPGPLAPEEPAIALGSQLPPWTDARGFRYGALGRFAGRVVVVSRRNYAIGEFAHLAPTDLAIVWGPLSDPRAYAQLSFDQRGSPFSGRYVAPELRAGTALAQRPFAETQAYLLANLTHVHTIAASDSIASQLAAIRPGQVVRFSGILVDVTSPAGGRYTSSLALHDYDCEIAWIDDLELVE